MVTSPKISLRTWKPRADACRGGSGGLGSPVAVGGHLSVPVSVAGMSAAAALGAVAGVLAEGIETRGSPRSAQVVRGSARRRPKAVAGSAAQAQRASSRRMLGLPLRASRPATCSGW